jgi:hypothetical protein
MSVATFDIPGLNVPYIFGKDVLPNAEEVFLNSQCEGDDVSPVLINNLKEIGYETHYMAPSMGSVYIFMLITIVGLLLIVIL